MTKDAVPPGAGGEADKAAAAPCRRGPIAVVAALSVALAACQNLVAESGSYYNSGLADSFNSLLLTNIVRAANGLPTYYSAIGDYSGSATIERQFGLGGEAVFGPGAVDKVNGSIGPIATSGRNANVSSLETSDFIQSMHTPLSPNVLFAQGEGGGTPQLNLLVTLIVESVIINASEFAMVVDRGRTACAGGPISLSGVARGICANLPNVIADASCAGPIAGERDGLVTLRNDATNSCSYARFRLFVEAATIDHPHIAVVGGKPVFSVGDPADRRMLFQQKGAGVVLRSPNGVVQYLGEVVRQAYEDQRTVGVTGREGRTIPIFVVRSGKDPGQSETVATVGGATYYIPVRPLGARETDFSYRSLAVVKDLLTLNTSHSQLAKNPTVIIGGPN